MLRGFRHKLLLFLQAGIFASGMLAVALMPAAWPAVLVTVAGASTGAFLCGRLARRYLNASIGRLRRVADDLGHGRPTGTLAAQPGDDMYKLISAINLLAARLAEASREEKRLHEELRRRERLAFLGELAASVAHEVNNPLDGIQNCARILRRSRDDPRRTEQMLDLIDSGLGRIELIVRRLLTLAREHVVRPFRTRISDVLEGALEAVAPKIDGRGLQLVRRYETGDDATLADRALLEQVFVNLVLNAADSMSEGGTLTVRLTREPAEPAEQSPSGAAHLLRVDITDTGTGIADDVLPHIFEPFFTTKPGGKGTGLGLAIASRIVDAHDGTIRVSSQPGHGSTFTVRIPVLPVQQEAAPTASDLSAAEAPTS